MRKRKFFDAQYFARSERMLVIMGVLFALGMAIATVIAGVDDVWAQLQKLSFLTYAQLILLSFLSVALRGARWPLYGSKLKLKVPPQRLWLYYFCGNAMIVTPGKLGAALRLWLLQKGHGIPYRRSVPLMMMDPITDLVALLVIAVASKLLVHDVTSPALWIFVACTALLIYLFSRPYLVLQGLRLGYRGFGYRGKKFWVILQKIVRSLTMLVRPRTFGIAIVMAILAWLCLVYGLQLVLAQLGYPLDFPHAAFLFTLPVIIGGATMTPGGLGTTEASMFGLMMLWDVPMDVAVTAIAVIRLFSLWLSVAFGAMLLPFALRKVAS